MDEQEPTLASLSLTHVRYVCFPASTTFLNLDRSYNYITHSHYTDPQSKILKSQELCHHCSNMHIPITWSPSNRTTLSFIHPSKTSTNHPSGPNRPSFLSMCLSSTRPTRVMCGIRQFDVVHTRDRNHNDVHWTNGVWSSEFRIEASDQGRETERYV